MVKRTNRVAWGLAVVLAVMSLGSLVSAASEPFSIVVKMLTPATKLGEPPASHPTSPREPPQYWSKIANDTNRSRLRRRRAVFQLFRQHINPGMRLSEMARLLNHPTWVQEKDIAEVTVLMGWIPVVLNFKDTVFVLVVLPDPGKDTEGIYLRVAGKVKLSLFRELLLGTGRASNQTRGASIVEIGLCEDPREKPCEHKGSRT